MKLKQLQLKTLLVAVGLLVGSVCAWADPVAILSWDLEAISDGLNAETTVASYGISENTTKIGSTSCSNTTGDLEGLCLQNAADWQLHKNNSSGVYSYKGLYNNGGGNRILGILNLQAGDIVTIAGGGLPESAINGTYDSEKSTDGTKIYTVTANGALGVSVTRYNTLTSITVSRDLATPYEALKSPYDTKVESLDAAGQAYWAANAATGESLTSVASYEAAVAALPTTYLAAVKAQTTEGSDMTDALLTEVSASSWTGATGTYNGVAAERYNDDTPYATGEILHQTVSGLHSGYYKVQFYAVANVARNLGSENYGSNIAQVYANSETKGIDVIYQDACTPISDSYLREFEVYLDTDNASLDFGIKNIAEGGQWYVAQALSLTYLRSGTYDYTINAVANGSVIKEFANGTGLTQDESYGVYIPKVVEYNNQFYVLDDSENANLDGYYASYTMGTSNATQEINYTLDETIVGYTEGEGSGYRNVIGSDNNSYSNGDYINNNGSGNPFNARNRGFSIGTLPAGNYQLVVYVVNSDNKRTVAIRNSADATTPVASVKNDDKITGELTANFSLSDATSLIVNGANSTDESKTLQCEEFDYVLIRKAPVAYTVKYMCGEEEIKAADATRTAIWGSTVTLTDADKANIINGGTYVYTSDDANSVEIASDGTSVITVQFTQMAFYTQTDVTEAATWDWSVVTSGNAYSQLTDDTNPSKSDEFVLRNVEVFGKTDGTSYTIPTGFGNAEQLKVVAEHPFRYASSKGMFQGNSIKFHTTLPGTVQVRFSNTGGDGTNRPYRYVSVNGILSATGSADPTEIGSEAFPVLAGDVTIKGYIPDATNPVAADGTNVGDAMLRIYSITFTPITEVSATIGSTGWTTFSSSYPLDLSELAEATAYYASEVSGGNVTMLPTTATVSAGEGLMLKGEAGATVTIPVADSGEAIDGNLLEGCITEQTITNETANYANIYVLGINSSDEAEFQNLKNFIDLGNSVTIPAGKAYLNVPTSGARSLRIVFDGEATGIKTVEGAEQTAEDCYNLGGQRVTAPQKGLYIVNGKKVVVK